MLCCPLLDTRSEILFGSLRLVSRAYSGERLELNDLAPTFSDLYACNLPKIAQVYSYFVKLLKDYSAENNGYMVKEIKRIEAIVVDTLAEVLDLDNKCAAIERQLTLLQHSNLMKTNNPLKELIFLEKSIVWLAKITDMFMDNEILFLRLHGKVVIPKLVNILGRMVNFRYQLEQNLSENFSRNTIIDSALKQLDQAIQGVSF